MNWYFIDAKYLQISSGPKLINLSGSSAKQEHMLDDNILALTRKVFFKLFFISDDRNFESVGEQ